MSLRTLGNVVGENIGQCSGGRTLVKMVSGEENCSHCGWVIIDQ